jgi:hypothetical protein
MLVKGWQPVWCEARQSGAFTPIPGTTGGSAPFPSVEPQPRGSHRLAFRPPHSVVIFDVDHYDEKTGMYTIDRAEEELGALPETWKVTSRGYGSPSGRYLYRKPEDLDFTDTALSMFAADGHTYVDIVRTAHRFSWAPGDINPKNGHPVQCYDAEGEPCWLPDVSELPDLPASWVEYLRNPPIPQSAVAYTRPSDGPEWWLSQADDSLGTRAELAQFAFDMLVSRCDPQFVREQMHRVSYPMRSSDPWTGKDFEQLTDANTQRKVGEILGRQDKERAEFAEVAGGDPELDKIAARSQWEYENRQAVIANVIPQVPFRQDLYQAVTQAAGIYVPPEEDDDPDDEGYEPPSNIDRIKASESYQQLMWSEMTRTIAKRDAAKALITKFTGFEDISDYPEPPDPSLFLVTGKDVRRTAVLSESTVTVMSGSRAAGKTWITSTFTAQLLRAGNHVLWIDFERQGRLLNKKLSRLGIARHIIQQQLHYTSKLPEIERILQDITYYHAGDRPVLVVVDAFRGLQNTLSPLSSANDGDAVEAVYIEYLNPVIEAGATVVLLDHIAKSGDGSTFGSERKESAADYVLRAEQVKPFTESNSGYTSVTVTKDRYGRLAAGTIAGYLWMPAEHENGGESIQDYPEIPELRNWSPKSDIDPCGTDDQTKSERQRNRILALVAQEPLKYNQKELAELLIKFDPDLFGESTPESIRTNVINRLKREGRLEADSSRKLSVPVIVMPGAVPVAVNGVDPGILALPEDYGQE